MTASVQVTMGRLPKELRDAPAGMVNRAERAAVSAGMPYLMRHLALATPTGATGKARQSTTMEMSLGPSVRGFVGYGGMASRYIGFVNTGTRPHWPPIAPLVYWAARKFGYGIGSPEAKRMGYLVARSISRKGTKAQRFIEGVVTRDRAAAQKLMADAARRAFRGGAS
jgi:hypothetical protein